MDVGPDQEAITDVINGSKFGYILFVGLTTADYQLEPLKNMIETNTRATMWITNLPRLRGHMG